MSFTGLLCSKATIWDVSESTAFGISETTSFNSQIDCRIQKKKFSEEMLGNRETEVGTHRIFAENSISLDVTKKLISENVIFRVLSIEQVDGLSNKNHKQVDAVVVK